MEVVDLDCDDPAGLFQFTSVRHPKVEQFGVIQDGNTLSKPLLALLQPHSSLRNGRKRIATLDERIVPDQLRVAKGVVVVHELTAANVLDDVADRALSTGCSPEPVLGRDGVEVAQQRMPIRSLESLIEQIYELIDG